MSKKLIFSFVIMFLLAILFFDIGYASKTFFLSDNGETLVIDGFYTGGLSTSMDLGGVNRLKVKSITFNSGVLNAADCNYLRSLKYLENAYFYNTSFEGSKICDSTFSHLVYLKSVVIKDVEIKHIGDFAFRGCSSLTKVYINGYLQTIGKSAFRDTPITHIGPEGAEYMQSLKGLKHIPEYAFANTPIVSLSFLPKVTEIGWGAFERCPYLQNVHLPELVTAGDYAFYNCQSLEYIVLPKLKTIKTYVMKDCDSLESISFPELTTMGWGAFETNAELETVNLPKLTNVAEYGFYQNPLLKNVTLPSVTTVAKNAFNECSGLLKIKLDSAQTFGRDAFMDCTNLTDAIFPSATNFERGLFYRCSNFFSLTLGATPPTVGPYNFDGTAVSKLLNIPSSAKPAYDPDNDQLWNGFVVSPSSSYKNIKAFSFNTFSPPVVGVINDSNSTIELTVPYNSDITSLNPAIELSDYAHINPTGTLDFSNPVVYTVTAQDLSQRQYTVNTNIALSNENKIETFTINSEQTVGVNIDEENKTIYLDFPKDMFAGVFPSITVSPDATVSPASGELVNFENPVVYTVTAQNGDTQQYTVKRVASTETKLVNVYITDFLPSLLEGTIDEDNKLVTIEVPFGTDITSLTPFIEPSPYATVSPENNISQDFTNPVTYTVTAENGDYSQYTVQVVTRYLTIVSNTGLSVVEGKEATIDLGMLRTRDDDFNHSVITYTVTSNPTNGILSHSIFTQSDINNNTISYDHNGSESTTDSFTFDVTDGAYTIKDQTFNINIMPVNDSPHIKYGLPFDETKYVIVNEMFLCDMNDIFTDFEGDPLTYKLSTNNGPFYDINHTFYFKPTAKEINVFRIMAHDGKSLSTSYYQLTIDSTNSKPYLAGDSGKTVNIGVNQTHVQDLSNLFTDGEGDFMFYGIEEDGHIYFTYMPTYYYLPTEIGTKVIKIYGYDGKHKSDDFYAITFNSINNEPIRRPTINETISKNITVGTPYSVNLNAIFSDPNEHELTFKASIDNGNFIDINSVYTTVINTVGETKSIVFKANDSLVESSDTYTVNLTAVEMPATNNIPVRVASIPEAESITAYVGMEYVLDLATIFEDNDSDGLTYYMENQGSQSEVSQVIKHQVNSSGSYVMRFIAYDGRDYSTDFYEVTINSYIKPFIKSNVVNPVNKTFVVRKAQNFNLSEIFDMGESVNAKYYKSLDNLDYTVLTSGNFSINPNSLQDGILKFMCADDNFRSEEYIIKYVVVAKAPSNNVPTLVSGTSNTVSESIVENSSYSLSLGNIFTDLDGDPLTYYVSVNGTSYTSINETYNYSATNLGLTTLVFKANDGIEDSAETYTVNLNVTELNNKPTRNSNIPEIVNSNIRVGNAYYIDLTTLFTDADNDVLSYKLSVNGESYLDLSYGMAYIFTPTQVSITSLKFIANDGKEDSTDFYEVIINANYESPEITTNLSSRNTLDSSITFTVSVSDNNDPNPVTEVKVNNSIIQEDTNGTYTADLQMGHNTILIKATDTDGNYSSRDFIITREAESLKGTVNIIGDLVYGKQLEAQVINTNNSGTLSYQWQREGVNIGENKNTYTITEQDVNKSLSVVVTSSVESGFITQFTSHISKADSSVTIVSDPSEYLKSHNIIKLNHLIGYEYLIVLENNPINTGSWQDSNVFTSLNINTSYDVYQRVQETNTHKCSNVSNKLTIKTLNDIVNSYTVEFISNGLSHDIYNNVIENEKISKPSTPIKQGYIFKNWFKDQDFINLWSFENDIVTNNLKLYAKFEKKDSSQIGHSEVSADRFIKDNELKITSKKLESNNKEFIENNITVSLTNIKRAAKVAMKLNEPVVIELNNNSKIDGNYVRIKLNLLCIKDLVEVGLVIKDINNAEVYISKQQLQLLLDSETDIDFILKDFDPEAVKNQLGNVDEVLFNRAYEGNIKSDITVKLIKSQINAELIETHVIYGDKYIDKITPKDNLEYYEISINPQSKLIITKRLIKKDDEKNYYEKVNRDGDEVILDSEPYINPLTKRSYVPLRFITEFLGADIKWIPETKQIQIVRDNKVILLTIDSFKALVLDLGK